MRTIVTGTRVVIDNVLANVPLVEVASFEVAYKEGLWSIGGGWCGVRIWCRTWFDA